MPYIGVHRGHQNHHLSKSQGPPPPPVESAPSMLLTNDRELTERELEDVTTVFHTYETGLRTGTIHPKVGIASTWKEGCWWTWNQGRHCFRHMKVKYEADSWKIQSNLMKWTVVAKLICKFSNPIQYFLLCASHIECWNDINIDAKCLPSFYNISIEHKP